MCGWGNFHCYIKLNGNSTSRTSTKWWPRHTESWRLWGGDERKLSELFSVFGVLLCMSCAQYTQVHVSKPQVCCFCMFFRFGIWYTVSKPCLGVLCIPNIYFFDFVNSVLAKRLGGGRMSPKCTTCVEWDRVRTDLHTHSEPHLAHCKLNRRQPILAEWTGPISVWGQSPLTVSHSYQHGWSLHVPNLIKT